MTGHYDPFRVALSIVISILSSWAALELAGRVSAERRGAGRVLWICWGATAMGFGIWSMHYVGMLAYRMQMPVLYDWPTVLLSMFAAVASSALALTILRARVLTWPASVFGSLAMGGGIAAMHYIGMAAMRMPMNVTYSRDLVLMSIAVAVLTSMVALRFTFASRHIDAVFDRRKIISALLMGLAIAEVHYLGMGAASWTPGQGNFSSHELQHAIQISNLSTIGLVLITGILLVLVMVTVGLDRHFIRYKSILRGSELRYSSQRKHNKRLQGAFRAGGIGIWECDPVTGAAYMDATLRRMYDLDTDEDIILRDLWIKRFHPDDVPPTEQRWKEAMASGDKYENEFRVLTRDGTRRFRVVASIFRDSHGVAQRVMGMTWDVTVERQREQETADQSERFEMTLEAVADAVITVDADCHVIYMNPVASVLTGWSKEEAVGSPLEQVFVVLDEATGEVRRGAVMQCMRDGKPFSSDDSLLLNRKGKRYNIKKRIAVTANNQAAVVTFHDVTVARSLERKLEYAATHDALTGLMNRTAFEKKLAALWEENRFNSRSHSLCILDLDRFKIINDTSGHIAGDALLREISRVMQQNVAPTDIVARMGGDEFMLLFVDTPIEESKKRANGLLKSIAELRFPWYGKTYDVTASLGLVEFDCFSPRPEVLISQADVASFTSKNSGRNRVSIYLEEDGTASDNHQEMQVVADLRRAIESDSFELHAQAIVPAGSSAPATYFEVLLRMRDENGDLVSPALFIPAAERYGLMTMVDRWVIHHALKMYGPLCGDCDSRFAINLSADSLSDPALWSYVQGEFLRSGVPPSSITFEVTETALIRSLETAKRFMQQAQLAGSRIALDDFGTGLSSLSYLKQFPLDVVKVDGSFIRQLLSNPLDRSIVHAVAQIARSMKAVTVAECVEDLPTITLLQQLGVDYVQGWATGRPGSMSVLMEGLRRRAEDDAGAVMHMSAPAQASGAIHVS